MASAQPPFFDTLVGKRIAGRYLVDRLLGSGGMGLVAAARYPELGQKVAIKFLRPELAADQVVTARFMREARLAAKVKSAHFVRVFDVGRLESGVPYLVMEMLIGRDLGDELRARGPLPVADAVDLVLQACAGVAEIHALGIVHRDLKPSNLFISTGASTLVKVLDFGISKEKHSESMVALTATDHVLGTPQYMSPEQVRASKDVDARSDLWSLGVILYELLTKTLPFVSEGGGVGEVFAKILYVDADSPIKVRADLPEELAALIMKCLSREPAARFQSVVELAEALAPYAAPSSLHRIDAVKQASLAPAVELDDDPILEVGENLHVDSGSQARTQESSPDAIRQRLVYAPTAPVSERTPPSVSTGPSEAGEVVVAPVTSMTSSSIVSASLPQSGRAKNRKLLAAALGVAVIGGALGLVLARGGPSSEPGAGMIGATSSTASMNGNGAVDAGVSANANGNANANANADGGAGETSGTGGAASAVTAASGVPAAGAAGGAVGAVGSARPRATATGAGAVGAKPPARPPASAAPHGSAPALILDRR